MLGECKECGGFHWFSECPPPCGLCGKPAKGYAMIGYTRYCHDGPDPTCYMIQSWEDTDA